MKVVIIVPTYNERDSVPLLFSRLSQELADIKDHEFNVLVVDDHSPDGTGNLVREMQPQYPFIHLLEGNKEGLGAAYARGFRYAIDELKAEAIMEMDADLSHDPKYIKEMLAALEEGADVALGSRYIEGGAIPDDWGLDRKLYSVLGNLVARFVLGIFSIRDFTSGFRLSRVPGFMDQIDFSKLLSKQYAYKIHLLYSLHELGAVIKEVPIIFVDRKEGYSKMPTNNIKDSLRVVFTLRYLQLEQFFKVCVVGTLGFIVQTIVYAILLRFSVASFNATVIGAEVAVLSMFPINNWWSFKNSAVTGKNYFIKMIQFNLVAFGSMAIQWLVLFTARYFFGKGFLADGVFYMIGILLGLIWNFTMYKKVVWRV